jgi:hypothetical protein
MKNAAVPTTAARGAAVSNRRMTAVQSVYIPANETLHHHPSLWGQARARAATSRFTGGATGRPGSRPRRSCLTLPWATPSRHRRGSRSLLRPMALTAFVIGTGTA